MKKDRTQIIAENPIQEYLASRGILLLGTGAEKKCKCPFHEDGTPSFAVNVNTNLWQCYAGCGGGSIIDLKMRMENLSLPEVMLLLGGEETFGSQMSAGVAKRNVERAQMAKPVSEKPASISDNPVKPKLVCTYDYRNAKGELVYQACRLEPKSFRQRRPVADGKWIWNMEGIERVLYRLPQVLKTTQPIFICEGEKDCDNVARLGWVATTNVGGAGKWLDAYSDTLAGKEVILCGDNDKPGQEHMDKVLASLAGKAKLVRWVKIPAPFKDVTDWMESLNGFSTDMSLEEHQHAQLTKLIDEAPMFDKGLNLPIQSMAELEVEFKRSVAAAETRSLDFSSFLPTLGQVVRPMIGGELVTIIAATKVGKTAIAQNLMRKAAPLKILNFQQELPAALSFERFAAMATNTPAREVYARYKQGQTVAWQDGGLGHIFSCHKTRLTCQQIEELILKSELKIGELPAVFVVDYIQLMGGKGERYERVSDAAEGMKTVCKNTGCIGIMLSQRNRAAVQGQDDATVPVRLTDGKESGGIENSSGLVLGAWRDVDDMSKLWIKVLANTKGQAGKEIACNFDGERLLITERIEQEVAAIDIPVGMPYAD